MATLAVSACLAVAGGLLVAGSAQASALPSLTLTITKSSMTVAGATQSGGVNIVTTATGTKPEASAILFLLKPGATRAEVEAFLASKQAQDPNYASKYGTIVFDTEVGPGHGSEAQISLQPGQYLGLLGGASSPKVLTSFTVTTASSPAVLPTPQATVRSIEFGFKGPSTLRDGELVRFENEGFLVHMDVAAQVKNMKVAKQLVKALLAGNEKAANKLAIGGVGFAGPLSSGAYQQETINAKPGIYVQACFMDTQDGRSHTQLGMERIIKIVK